MQITAGFDSGNIRCIDCSDPSNVRLTINKDHQSDFYQWFHFRASGVCDMPLKMVIENAKGAAYVGGWENYQAVASYDRQIWFRVPTTWDGETLTIDHAPETDAVYYAYFAPYSMERHADLVAAAVSSGCTHELLGSTLDGQDMDLLRVGEGPLNCWLIARQHPGESMAEWWMEGLLDRLLEADDPVARLLKEKATFHIVPNMNPDGSARGHLRTNAVGANLNREWKDASSERSPEVLCVREAMAASGVDFCLDVHGDEALPYNFIAAAEGIDGWTERLHKLTETFKSAYVRANPDFQTKYGYEVDAPNSSDLKKCTDYVAQTHDCLSMTLEMPFKDNADAPDEVYGWSPDRCRILGHSVLDALLAVIDDLR
ncbi:MAG: hypothetical protein DHS20C11_33880 [Lysobacteraceae bacterium]|nr:MAG: hypothetical protein DHS20C11_33880 [Xanthomonadaceae bacterium]